MYVDDTSITFAGSDVDEINSCINLDLERIRVWLAANKLTLNDKDRIPSDWFQAKAFKFYSESYC